MLKFFISLPDYWKGNKSWYGKILQKYFLLIIISLGIAGALGYLGYQNHKLKQEKTVLEKEFSKTNKSLRQHRKIFLAILTQLNKFSLQRKMSGIILNKDLLQKQEAMDSIGVQVQAMAGTVGALQN